MQKFLLLRNNKQTGPYSVEELEQMGLKPYDLIWVNGKSAAWRYPGEVDELKSFAPAVEEQPFDRFYKKSTEDTSRQNGSSHTETRTETAVAASANTTSNSGMVSNNNTSNPAPQKKDKEYKRVFVTMPVTGAKATSSASENAIKESAPVTKEATPVPPVKKAEPIPAINAEQQPQKIKSTYDEANGHSTIDVYYTRRSIVSSRSFLISALCLGVLALVGLGMFIGLSLNQPATREAGKQETEKVYRVIDHEGGSNIPGQDHNLLANQPVQASIVVPDSSNNNQHLKKHKPARALGLKTLKDNQQKAIVKPIDTNLLVIKPEKEKQEAEKKIVEKPAPNLAKLVSVSSNEFQVGPFGGISKLELTVHNKSEYDLNLVVVDVDYIKVNKEVYKTETVYFKNVNAGSSLTLNAPKSSRGNKINYRISLISSKDRLFHTPSN